jgi:hypothetical protein
MQEKGAVAPFFPDPLPKIILVKLFGKLSQEPGLNEHLVVSA